MKRIIYTLDGKVQVVMPAPQFVSQFETDEEGIQAVIAKDVPASAVDVAIVDDADLPKDGVYRFAWKREGTGLPFVDLDKAKELHKELIAGAKRRKARELMEREFAGEDVSAEKAELARDQTADITKARTLDELKTVWPPELPR